MLGLIGIPFLLNLPSSGAALTGPTTGPTSPEIYSSSSNIKCELERKKERDGRGSGVYRWETGEEEDIREVSESRTRKRPGMLDPLIFIMNLYNLFIVILVECRFSKRQLSYIKLMKQRIILNRIAAAHLGLNKSVLTIALN